MEKWKLGKSLSHYLAEDGGVDFVIGKGVETKGSVKVYVGEIVDIDTSKGRINLSGGECIGFFALPAYKLVEPKKTNKK